MTALMDRMLNIDTVSLPEKITRNVRFDDFVTYEGLSYWKLWKYINFLKPSRNDVVFDIGCGMGQILCVFGRKAIRKCVGIEI